jgi:hypothetical protein
MSPWLIVLVGCVYSYISVESFCLGKMGTSIIFAGYAFSNIGLWMATK